MGERLPESAARRGCFVNSLGGLLLSMANFFQQKPARHLEVGPMARYLLAVLVALSVMVAFTDAADACGDKFLVSGPGVRYGQLHAAVHPSSLLLYRNPASESAKSVLGSDLEFALELAGHSVKTVDSIDELLEAIASGKYRVVMADVSDTDTLGDSSMVVVPIADTEVATSAAAQFDTVVSPTSTPEQIVASIDAALEASD